MLVNSFKVCGLEREIKKQKVEVRCVSGAFPVFF